MDTSQEPKATETLYGAREGGAFSAGKRSHRWPMLVREQATERPPPSLGREHAMDGTHETAGGRQEERSPELDAIDGHPDNRPIPGTTADAGAEESEDVDRPEGAGHFEAADQPEDDQQLVDPEDAQLVDPENEVLPEEAEDAEDALFLLGERCARAYMRADALHYQAMKLLAEFDRRSGWRDTGFSSTAEWLAWRIGIKPNAARERLRTALALEQLPQISEAMENGEISYTKVRALTRVAKPETEPTLLDFARAGSAANLERMVRGWRTLDRKGELTAEQIRHRSRRFSAFVDDDGMVVVKGRLDPEVGALFMRAVEAASDALYKGEHRQKGEQEEEQGDETGRAGKEGGGEEQGGSQQDMTHVTAVTPQDGNQANSELDETTPEQRRADAVGLIAERAFAAGFGSGAGGEVVSGSRAERYQVMLHVDADTLKEDGDLGQSELEDGTRVTAVTSRRIACDSGLVEIAHGPDGEVVGAGRRIRTVNPSLRRALEARDRGCRFPGCGLRFTEAHHVKHWADGGETTLRNTTLLCRVHHRAVHEGGVRVCIDVNGQIVFFTPKGKALLGAPPRQWDHPTGATGAGSDTRPYHLAGGSRWARDEDIPWEIEAQAWEALEAS